MNSPPKRQIPRQQRMAAALRLAQIGDLVAARAAMAELLATDSRNGELMFNLGLVEEQRGEIEEAAALYARALRHAPKLEVAARRLARLLDRYEISDPAALDPAGLAAALALPEIALQPIAATVLRQTFLGDGPLAREAAAATADDRAESAHALIATRTHPALAADRLRAALAAGVVRIAAVEHLLTAIRRAMLLELPLTRFEDRDLYAFAIALMQAAHAGDFAWAEAGDESEALAAAPINVAALVAGDMDMSRRLLMAALYRPLEGLLGAEFDLKSLAGIRPKVLRDVVIQYISARAAEREMAAALPRLQPLADVVSRRVAEQYERSPYPRWTRAVVGAPAQLKPTLSRYFPPSVLAQFDQSFDVLIAGAGTGQQVVQSASVYGPNARVLAIDLSAPSLAYARRKVEAYGVSNVEFMVADILDLGQLDRQFNIIECVGVLHHMADPMEGWRKLLGRLAPGGIAYIGLYSAISRVNIASLRKSPDHPGPGCTDQQARIWRQNLMQRPKGTPGSELLASRNFYNLNEFRDLVLHESEQQFTLPEIERFLADHGLRFAGFTLEKQIVDEFRAFTGETTGPGQLSDWHRFEQEQPSTFDAMYRFWIERME